MREGLGPFLAYKLVVFVLAFFALAFVAHITPVSPGHFVNLMFQWDALHVLRVASEGYLAKEPSIQIFPAFPMLIRVFQLVFRDWNLSAFLAVQVCSFFAFYYFFRLARTELSREHAVVATILFALFPTAYFLSVPYTEAAFCAASFATVYYLRTENYAAGAVAAFLAALARMNGVFLLPAIAVHAWVNRRRLSRRQLLGLTAMTAAGTAGFLVYLGANFWLYGDPFHFIGLQGSVWYVHTSWPFKGAVEAIATWPVRSASDRLTIIVMEIGFTLGALAFVPLLARRERAFEFTYVAINLGLLTCMDFWLSRPRYVIILYPMFFLAAPWVGRSVTRLCLTVLASSGLFALCFSLYLSGQWAH